MRKDSEGNRRLSSEAEGAQKVEDRLKELAMAFAEESVEASMSKQLTKELEERWIVELKVELERDGCSIEQQSEEEVVSG